MSDQKILRLRIKTKDEARRTIQESFLIDRGFLSKSNSLILIFSTAAIGVLAPIWLAIPLAILALDYAWFVVRRRHVLRTYESGQPRLETPADFEAIGEEFRRSAIPEPTMTDWHEAAGFADVPNWREDLRYRVAASYYRGGVLLDVGCGDGRLCWRYHACDPRKYIGADITPGLLAQLSSKTDGQAKTVLAVAEALGLPDESVDLLICSEAFEHLPEPEAALAEFSRVLKRNGRIVIQSPNALRLRNFNPFHIISLFVGYWYPFVLLAKKVHANTFVYAFTYHWDFTRQDFTKYLRTCPALSVRTIRGATYRFNPDGSTVHRLLARLFRLPIIHWLGWDLTVILDK